MIKFHGSFTNCENYDIYVAPKFPGVRYMLVLLTVLTETTTILTCHHINIVDNKYCKQDLLGSNIIRYSQCNLSTYYQCGVKLSHKPP